MPDLLAAVPRDALLDALHHPEGPLRRDAVSPVAVAASTAVGLAGASAFLAVHAARVAPYTAGPWTENLGEVLPLVAVPPLAAVLSVPPLFLLTALRGRAPGLLRLLAVAAAGPSAAGAFLGAATPLSILFALTGGGPPGALLLLGVLLALLAVVVGGWAAACAATDAGPQSPGLLVALGHYAFTLWAGLVLTVHLLG